MIQKYQKTDAEQVMNIWLQGNKDGHPFIPQRYWESNLKMVQDQLSRAEVYVYKKEKTIRGFIGIQDDYIAGIFIERDYRRTGIGKQLLDYVKALHPVLTLNVYQKNQQAVKFYQREGFTLLSEDIDTDTREIEYTMIWRLHRADHDSHLPLYG